MLQQSSIINPFGGAIHHYPCVESTMIVAKNSPKCGDVHIADSQTHGRGRFPQRQWHSITGQDLTFTLCLSERWLSQSVLLPLQVALAMQYALSSSQCALRIKWPNDIIALNNTQQVAGKIAGILCQKEQSYYYIGIGVNLAKSHDLKTFQRYAIGDILGYTPQRESVLSAILQHLAIVLQHQPWQQQQAAINQYLYMPDHPLQYQVGNQRIEGDVIGISIDGGLQLRTHHGLVTIHSGEVTPMT